MSGNPGSPIIRPFPQLQAHSELAKTWCYRSAFSGTAKVRRKLCARSVKPFEGSRAVAADAGVMQIQLSEGWVWRRS
jgi:hypothetical protein